MAIRRNTPTLWHPMRELTHLQQSVDRLFGEALSSFPDLLDTPRSWSDDFDFSPPCDVEESGTHYVMSFDLPGLKKEDIKIELSDNQLRVSGERKEEHEEKGKSRYRMERRYGSFERTFTVPSGLAPDQIETEYQDGVLRIAFPKQQRSEARQINVGQGKSGVLTKMFGRESKVESKKAA